MRKTMISRVALVLVFAIGATATASAQTPGPRPGAPFAGDLLATEVVSKAVKDEVVRTETLTAAQLGRSDSLLNGALIGAAAALGTFLLVCRAMEPWENCVDDYGPMLRFAAVGAGIGLGVDALISPSRTSPLDPIGGKPPIPAGRRTGLRLSVSF